MITRAWHVRRSHISMPKVRISRKMRGSFAVYMALLPAKIPIAQSYEMTDELVS